MSHFNDHLDSIVRQLQAGYNSNELFFNKNGLEHPNPSEIIDILNDFRQLLFPGYFGTDQPTRTSAPYFAGQMLHSIYERLYPQIRAALAYQEGAVLVPSSSAQRKLAAELMAELPAPAKAAAHRRRSSPQRRSGCGQQRTDYFVLSGTACDFHVPHCA